MKNNAQEKLSNINLVAKSNPGFEKSKTTNINILLNRVKLDKKKDLKKKIIFLSLLVFVISFISIFAII